MEKRNVFSSFLNCGWLPFPRMLAGSLFHSVGPAQANARRPKRSRLTRGTSRSSPPAERRLQQCGKVLWCASVECLVHKDEYLILNPSLNWQPVKLPQYCRHGLAITPSNLHDNASCWTISRRCRRRSVIKNSIALP